MYSNIPKITDLCVYVNVLHECSIYEHAHVRYTVHVHVHVHACRTSEIPDIPCSHVRRELGGGGSFLLCGTKLRHSSVNGEKKAYDNTISQGLKNTARVLSH